jgi:hypothetical protein
MNSPQSISRPRPGAIGGGGSGRRSDRRQYADATNVFGGPEQIHHKYEVLREHCGGRTELDEIERSRQWVT